MKNRLTHKETFLVAIMLFGMFFGAGNLIFPIILGAKAGASLVPALLGMLITAVGMPLLGIVALGVSRSSGLMQMSGRVAKWYSYFFTCALYLTIGPFFAIPRCAATSFTMGIAPLVSGSHTVPQAIFTTLFFAAVFGFLGGLTDFVADLIARKVLSARRKKLENRVGNAVTRAVGGVFDGMVEGLNQTVLRGHRIEHHAMARISAAWDGAMDAISQMSHTMSYGLLLFGLGLCVTLLYLMFY